MIAIVRPYRSQVSSVPLCSACRQDLLLIWTTGPDAQVRARPHRKALHYASAVRRSSRQPQSIPPAVSNPTTPQKANRVRYYAALPEADLESKSQAPVELDSFPPSDQHKDGSPTPQNTHQANRDGGGLLFDPIHLARSRNQSQEDVARLARQQYGELLPAGVLDEGETKIYIRLYGQPREAAPGSAERDWLGRDDNDGALGKHTLLDAAGDVIESGKPPPDKSLGISRHKPDLDFSNMLSDEKGRSSLFRDQTQEGPGSQMVSEDGQIKEIARALGGSIYEQDWEVDNAVADDGSSDDRQHLLTAHGKFQTSPRTVFLPRDEFVRPIEHSLAKFSNKQLKEMCERILGGPGLPDSALTPYSARTRQQVPIPLEASQHFMGEMESNAFISTIMPPVYSSVLSTLTETRKRLGSEWLRGLTTKEGGPRILDAGASGAGILAWNAAVKAEWANLNGPEAATASPPPPSKAVVLVGSDTLRRRAAALLDNTTFVPRLPDYAHSRNVPTLEDSRPAQSRKHFDVIIASHTLFRLKEEFERKQHVQNLWSLLSPDGGILILLEKGIPRGFEAIAGARQFILDRYISSPGSESYESPLSDALAQKDQITKKEPGMIVAPCTNHNSCPMYTIPGLSKGRKDFCSFKQRFVRPPFLHRIMEGGHTNYEDVGFSYVVAMKGKDLRTTQPETVTYGSGHDPATRRKKSTEGFESLTENHAPELSSRVVEEYGSRLVFSPLKRKGHVSMDVCTPMGSIERWTVPKSFSKQAYHDARKARWGDIWALGAKTTIPRNLNLGRSETKEGKKADKKRQIQVDRAEERRERMEVESLDEQALEKETDEIAKQERLRKIMAGETDGSEVQATNLGKQSVPHSEEGDDDDGETLWDDLTPAEREEILAMERDLDSEQDWDDEVDEDQDTPTSPAPFSPVGPRKPITDKKLAALEAQASASSSPTSVSPSTKSPPDHERLLETLRQEAEEEEVERKLKEWEEEFAMDKTNAAVAVRPSGRARLGRSGRRKYQ